MIIAAWGWAGKVKPGGVQAPELRFVPLWLRPSLQRMLLNPINPCPTWQGDAWLAGLPPPPPSGMQDLCTRVKLLWDNLWGSKFLS